MKRDTGEGSVTRLRNGRYWVRTPAIAGKRDSLGTYATEAEAVAVLAEYRRTSTQTSLAVTRGQQTFSAFALSVLKRRREDKMRSIYSQENRYKSHLATCDLADMAMVAIRPIDIHDLGRKLLRTKRKDGERCLSRSTVKACLTLVSGIMADAVLRNIRPDNPCVGVKLPKSEESDGEGEDKEDKWDWLRPDEQVSFKTCDQIPEWGRVMVMFAVGTGLRQGEQWNLELRDVHCDKDEAHPYVFVRYGSKGRSPKNRKTRRVDLFGEGLAAMRRWLEILPAYASSNPDGLVFPGPSGARRGSGGPTRTVRVMVDKEEKVRHIYLLPEWLALAGVDRHLRWHDLRHTCASSLVSGAWGRKWRLEEVCPLMGHSSVVVTEIYAHLSNDAQREAAEATSGLGAANGYAKRVSKQTQRKTESIQLPAKSRLRDLNSRPAVYESQDISSDFETLGPDHNPAVTQDAAELLRLIAEGSPFAMVRATELAAKLLPAPKKEKVG